MGALLIEGSSVEGPSKLENTDRNVGFLQQPIASKPDKGSSHESLARLLVERTSLNSSTEL